MELNHFSDMTEEEIKSTLTGLNMPANIKGISADELASDENFIQKIPSSLDWRDKSKVSAV